MTNGYDVEFLLPSTLANYLNPWCGNVATSSPTDKGVLVKWLCDEAQLPNVQAATGTISGKHLGENQVNFPYAKFYSDLSLSWMCDADMVPLKFVTGWHSYIFSAGDPDDPVSASKGLTAVKSAAGAPRPINRAVRLRWPEQYLAPILKITKTEKNGGAPNGRAPISYYLENAYPYSVDSVPLSYGTSQITKVTANFYYQKHTVVMGDGTN